MNARELVREYLDCFYKYQSLETMKQLFAADLQFSGPFHQYHSAQDYIQALQQDPPANSDYRILYEFEQENSICVVYEIIKPDVKTTMAQIFEISDGKISRILLIFDTGAFQK